MNGLEVLNAMKKHCNRNRAAVQKWKNDNQKEIDGYIEELNRGGTYLATCIADLSKTNFWLNVRIDDFDKMSALIDKLYQQLASYVVTCNGKNEMVVMNTDRCVMFEDDDCFVWAKQVLDFARNHKALMSAYMDNSEPPTHYTPCEQMIASLLCTSENPEKTLSNAIKLSTDDFSKLDEQMAVKLGLDE